MSVADHLQRANHITHLVVQERAGFDNEMNFFSSDLNIQSVQRFNRGFGLACRGAERTEIMVSDKITGSLTHFFNIQRHRNPPNPVFFQYGRSPAVKNPVEVTASSGAETGMEIISDFFNREKRQFGDILSE